MELSEGTGFAELLVDLRLQQGLTQADLAGRLEVTQQTVSRWEKGLARPRAKEMPKLAQVLECDVPRLLAAAGYETSAPAEEGRATLARDQPLPLYALQPETFERFCTDFLNKHYRPLGGRAERYGSSGHKQHGIDIVVTLPNATYAFQCKRVTEFGEQKVHKAVLDQTYRADLSVLLLSNVASPKARDAIHKHQKWELWDREDISRLFRDLSIGERRDLVDTYFPGQRMALLGTTEDGPFQSAQQFFKPFESKDSVFSQAWDVVGRDQELAKLKEATCDTHSKVTLLSAAPGAGKSRLLRHLAQCLQHRRPRLRIEFASPTEDVRLQDLEQLPQGEKLLVVDDAHDRDDLAQMFRFAADNSREMQLLVALRPYRQEAIELEAIRAGIAPSEISTVTLEPMNRAAIEKLTKDVLAQFDGPAERAAEIAKASHGAPLVAVLAAQVISKRKTSLELLGNEPDFQKAVLASLQDVLTGQIVAGNDVQKLHGVLRVVAALQPIAPDDPVLLNILQRVEGVDADDAKRLIRLLTDAGVLFRRGFRWRLGPDLLADSIIESKLMEADGKASGKVAEIFDLADTQYLKHLLLNLGRLEWRILEGKTDTGRLLSSLLPKLLQQGKPRQSHIEAVQAVAYYQPKLAILFARKLIESGQGQHSGVGAMLKFAAYNFNHLRDACLLLWKAGKDDGRPLNQNPYHGIRVLQELAQFAPRKPPAYVESVVSFALELFQRPRVLSGEHTPFEILEGALRTEMQETTSSARSVTITRYSFDLNVAVDIRRRISDELISSIAGSDTRRAFLAALTLAHALRSPMEGGDRQRWAEEHCAVLDKLYEAISAADVHPVVLTRVASSVGWHAGYGSEPSKSKARKVIDLLDLSLERRLVRALVDAWGTETWKYEQNKRKQAHEAHTDALIKELTSVASQPSELFDLLAHWISQLRTVAGRGWGAPGYLVGRLLKDSPGFAQEVLERRLEPTPLSEFDGAALSVLIADEGSAKWALQSALKTDDGQATLRLIAEAYARRDSASYDANDYAILERIFSSTDPQTLFYAASIVLRLAKVNPAFALEMVCKLDFTVAPGIVEQVFMWVGNDDTIPGKAIQLEHWRKLLHKLSDAESLGDHWVRRFLRLALKVVPGDVIAAVKRRLLRFAAAGVWYKPALQDDFEHEGLGLLESDGATDLLRDLLDWAVKQDKPEQLAYGFGPTVAALTGKYDPLFLENLLSWFSEGTLKHVQVAAALVRSAQSSLIYDHPQFVRNALNAAELVAEDEGVQLLSDAFFAATISGGRMGTPGEPFPEDLQLQKHASETLATLSTLDPAYDLFKNLLAHANDGIERQLREKEVLDLEDDAQ